MLQDDIFKNIKILELSTVLAGPLVGTFFAELGAKVIKVENPKSNGDPTRQWRLPSEPKEKLFSAYYAAANYKKENIFLDLTNLKDFTSFKELVKKCDVFISNLNDKSALKLGIDFDSLKVINKHLIYGQIYAYDKMDSRPGYDAIMQAECGYIAMNGVVEHPAKIPVALIDVLASHQLKEGILIAMLKNSSKPLARKVEVSLYATAVASLANQASNYLMYDHQPLRMGTAHPNIAPYGDVYLCNDGKYIMLAIGSDNQFKKLVETLRIEDKVFPMFTTNLKRVAYRAGLNEILQAKIKDFTCVELKEVLRRKQLPHSSIYNFKEVFDNPLAQKMIRKEDNQGEKLIGVKTIAFDII